MRIVHIRNDGSIAITTMANSKATVEEMIDHANELTLKNPDYINYILMNDYFVPTDRYFREAWKHETGNIAVNMDKAKNIHLDKLRDIRSQKFIDLGFPQRLNPQVENAILDETTKAKLKELRDFPQTLDLTNVHNPDQLKNIIPECLK